MFGLLKFLSTSGGEATEYTISRRQTFVGRDTDCSIRFNDSSVDWKQFLISCNDQGVKIQNLSQKVPTQVNQKSIGLKKDRDLKDQDIISFGKRKFVWTMSSISGKSSSTPHYCLKRTRVSEPVRKVAVVTPNQRAMPFQDNWGSVDMHPGKRRRTMLDPSRATPEQSSFAVRVSYDKQLRRKTLRRKQSGNRTPASASSKQRVSFSQQLPHQMSYDHETAFNKSITPGRFYRRQTDEPYKFRGFNAVPEEPTTPGLLSGCDSFLSTDDEQVRRLSSARVSSPYPNKLMRGSTQSHKTPSIPGPSGLYFKTIQEEMTHFGQQDATPSSYFSSTSGSPRIMRAESPTILPGSAGSSFQGRRSLMQSRSSSYGTPQERSLTSQNDSMYVNASGSNQMIIQDFEGSSLNQSCYSWTDEGIRSPQADSFEHTPHYVRTPRRSHAPAESPGSAAFSPNPSDASASGYVLLSPRGKNIINRAFNRNDMSLKLSPHHSPSRRSLNFSPRTPDRRRIEPVQPLSVQLLTKSLKRKLNRSASNLNSPYNYAATPSSSRKRASKNMVPLDEHPSTPESVPIASPKSTGSKRSALRKSKVNLSVSQTPDAQGSAGASKRKSSKRQSSNNEKSAENMPEEGTPTGLPRLTPQSSSRGATRSSWKFSDLKASPSPAISTDVADIPLPPTRSNTFTRSSRKSSDLKASPARPSSAGGATGTPLPLTRSNTFTRSSRKSSDPKASPARPSSAGAATGSPLPLKRSNTFTRSSRKSSDLKASPSLKISADAAVSSPLPLTRSNTFTRSSRKSSDLKSSPSLTISADAADVTPLPLTRSNTFTRSSRKSSDIKSSPVSISVDAAVGTPLPWTKSNTSTPGSEGKRGTPRRSTHSGSAKSPPVQSPGSTGHNLPSGEVTPPGTSVEITMRSSRKLSTKKRDSPITPLTVGKAGPYKRTLTKSLSEGSILKKSPRSSARKSLPVSLVKSGKKGGNSIQRVLAKNRLKSQSTSETALETFSPVPKRSSRASLISDAAQFLHLSTSPDIPTQSVIPVINVVPPTPDETRSTRASRGSSKGRTSSSFLSLPRGIRKTSAGKRSSLNAVTPEPEGHIKKRSSRHSVKVTSVTTADSSPRAASSSRHSDTILVTPPRSAKPEVVMRSSRKTQCLSATKVASSPTSSIPRNKRSSAPLTNNRVGGLSPKVVRKLSLDPEKPDKNKMAALIACHKKKSPSKENRPSTSFSGENISPGKSRPETLTPLKDLDVQPEERSPEDALLDALDLSRKSSVVTESKKPSRRLRSLTNRQASAQSSGKRPMSAPNSPPKSVKKLLFRTPLVEYEGSYQRVESSPSKSLKGILLPSPSTSEKPMSVFTTSPVVDFTDASGRKKIFRASPNSKSEAGGIRELVPDDETDLNIWTLFEASSSDSVTSVRKRKNSAPTEITSPQGARARQSLETAGSTQSKRRKVDGASAKKGSSSSPVNTKPVKSGESAKSPPTSRRGKPGKILAGKTGKQSKNPPNISKAKPKKGPAPSAKVSPKKTRGKLATSNSKAPMAAQQAKSKKVSAPTPKKTRGKLTSSKSTAPKKVAASSPKVSPKKTRGKLASPKPKAVSSAKPKKVANLSPKVSPKKTRGKLASPKPKAVSSAKPKKVTILSPKVSPKKTRGKLASSKSTAPKAVQIAKSKKVSAPSPKVSPKKARGKLASAKPTAPKAVQLAKPKKASAPSPNVSPKKTRGKLASSKAAQLAKPKKVATPSPKVSGKKTGGKVASQKSKAAQPAKPLKVAAPALKTTPKKTRGKLASPKPKAASAKPKKAAAPSPKVSPKKTSGKLPSSKSGAPKAKPKSAQKGKPRSSVPLKSLAGKAVGARASKKPATVKASPSKTRPRQPTNATGGRRR